MQDSTEMEESIHVYAFSWKEMQEYKSEIT
jgi:hypothetical protein